MPAPQTGLSDVIDLRLEGPMPRAEASASLAKTATLEVRRLILPRGAEIPTHQAPGEITVHCLGGHITFTACQATRELRAGQMLVLAAGEPHSLCGLDDSVVLVTKVLSANPAGAGAR